MSVVSISLNNKILHELDDLQHTMGFSGRSETIRAAVRMLVAENKQNKDMLGTIDATVMVIHDEKYSDRVSKIWHDYQDMIKTQVHNHLENHKCLEIFVVKGDAERIKKMVDDFHVNKCMDYVKLIVS